MNTIKNIYRKFRLSRFFKPVLYFVIFLFLIVIFDQIVMPLYVKAGREVEMPDVLELSVQDAVSKLGEYGFGVMISDSLYDPKHPGGTVIEQNPYPYAQVKKGRRVYLTVSIGERPVIMPNLFGVSPREAELILQSRDLMLNGKSYVFSDIYHEGTVMGQSFPQGQPVKAGSRIDITISLGRMNQERVVPNLQGKSLYEAREILRALGMKIGQIEYAIRPDILPETVTGQSLAEGTTIGSEASIDLTVSREK